MVPGRLKCPNCDYLLLGLPDRHTCPECGFEYDPHCAVIRLGGRNRYAANAVGGLFIAGMMLWPGPPLRDVMPCAVPLLLLVAYWTWRWCRQGGSERRLIIDRDGIRLQHPNAERRISWADFGKARVSWIPRSFVIYGRDSQVLLRARYYEFGSILLMQRVADKMNHLAQVYTNESASTP